MGSNPFVAKFKMAVGRSVEKLEIAVSRPFLDRFAHNFARRCIWGLLAYHVINTDTGSELGTQAAAILDFIFATDLGHIILATDEDIGGFIVYIADTHYQGGGLYGVKANFFQRPRWQTDAILQIWK